jgi:hypothetical protein
MSWIRSSGYKEHGNNVGRCPELVGTVRAINETTTGDAANGWGFSD